MASRGRELKVYLTSDTSRFLKGLKRGESGMRKFARGVGIGAAAVSALAIKLGTDAVQAAAEDEKRMAKLTKVMENFGKAAELPELNDAIDAMQRQYGVAEDQLTPAFIRLLSATDDTDQALKLLTLSLDLSAASGKTLDMSAKSLARAIEGSTGGLAKLGVGLSAADIKAAGLEGTIGILEDRFGGTAARAADTMTGKLERVSIALGEVSEAGGAGILDGFIGPDVDEAMGNIQDIEDDAYRVGMAVGTLGTNLLKMASDLVQALDAISTGWSNWIDDGGRRLTDIQDFLGIVSDEEGQAINNYYDRQYEDRVLSFYQRNQPRQQPAAVNPYAAYRPMRFATRKGDAEVRGSARAAQREARTRSQP